MDDPTTVKLLGGAVTGLIGVIGLLWKDNQKWQDRWRREVKDRNEDAKLFLKGLDRLQRDSVRPTPIQTKTSPPE